MGWLGATSMCNSIREDIGGPMEALATKYRPQSFGEVAGQKYIIDILQKQIRNNTISNCYLFAGPTGTGKTTLARIFANSLNEGCGNPIEIDAASNNGVDNIRTIIEESQLKSLDSKYRVYIIDEVHMITKEGWNAFLKTLEEPTLSTIFILCTTEPQKVPATILNRVMRFNLSKIPSNEIKERLNYICAAEGFTNYTNICDYISKISQGGLRDAIAMLDKCSKYSTDLDIKYAQQVTGMIPYESMMELTNSLTAQDGKDIVKIIDGLYEQGYDLKLLVDQYIDFIVDLEKYIMFNDISVTKFPTYIEEKVVDGELASDCLKYVVNVEGLLPFLIGLVERLLNLKFKLKYDTSVRDTVTVFFMSEIKKW